MSQSDVFPNINAPMAEKRPIRDEHHGHARTDDYAWLRDDNWQEVFRDPAVLDADIRKHLEAENAYQAEMMADTVDLQKQLFNEMRSRIKEDDSSVPMKDGAFAYGTAYRTGGQHARFFRTPREGGEETVLLDGDAEAEGKPFFNIGDVEHSSDHDFIVWSFDDKGSEFYSLKVRDTRTGADLADLVPDTGGSGVWDAANEGFFYTRLDPNHRPSRIFYHKLGDDVANDRLVYEEEDPGFFVTVEGTRTNRWIFISIHDHETSEYRVMPADNPMAEPRLVRPRETGVQYDLEDGGDFFYILTNLGDAKDFRIMTAPAGDPAPDRWRELVPHEPGRLILGLQAFARHMTWLERRDGLPRIVVRDRMNGSEHAVDFAEEAYALGLGGAFEFDTATIRFSYSSMTTPAQIYDYDMASRERTLLKTQEVPSGHDPALYVTRRLMAPADDGEEVPVTILYHRDTPLDGSAPCLLYGYGSYGISIPAAFNTNCLSLVDRGFVYAIAHVRGGKDKGFAWYEDGKRENKENTFTDFIAGGRHLVAEDFTSHDRIVAQGGSAGGMVMGAIANMAPDDFGAIIAEVPFVDVLTTMLDDTLPLTPPEWPEWGNPLASPSDYEVIAAYSPYDNITARDYPPILALTGLTDPRVTYWEPAKWVVKLRDMKTDDNPILFKINMDAGHAGASGRFSRLEEIAYSYAYALKVMGKAD